MRLGLLGDIHGNALAMESVLQAMACSEVDALCATGDFVGYYYESHKVFEMLSKWRVYAVRGNHEDMLISCLKGQMTGEQYHLRYGSGLAYAISRLSSVDIENIRHLPRTLLLELDGKKLLLAHGAPWDTNCYLYPDAESAVWDRVTESSCDYLVLGHTHYKMSKRVGDTLVINPGSVGQPRDRQTGADWAVLDTHTGCLEQRVEAYDINHVAVQARSIDPHLPYLWGVLNRQ
jgi:putative phosphoesterase